MATSKKGLEITYNAFTPVDAKLVGWHIAGDSIYAPMYIQAATIQEAVRIYHELKHPRIPQSTVAPKEEEKSDVQ